MIEKQLLSIILFLVVAWVIWDELKGNKTISKLILNAAGGSDGSGGGGGFTSGDTTRRVDSGGGGGGFR